MSGSWSNVSADLIVLVEETAGFSGFFAYSPTPAAGNLVFSLTVTSGTDPYGNAYLSGLTIYSSGNAVARLDLTGHLFLGNAAAGIPEWSWFGNQVQTRDASNDLTSIFDPGNTLIQYLNNPDLIFQQLDGTSLRIGQLLAAGVPPTPTELAQAGSLAWGLGILQLQSGEYTPSGLVDMLTMQLKGGATAQPTGSATCPAMLIQAADNASATDIYLAGSMIATNPGGSIYTWQNPGAAANWSMGSVQFKRDVLDQLDIIGSFSFTGTTVTGAGAATITTANAAAYRPKKQWKVPLVHYTSTSVQKNVAASLLVNTDGTWSVQWGDGMTGTTHDANGLANGDIFWVEASVPMGNLP